MHERRGFMYNKKFEYAAYEAAQLTGEEGATIEQDDLCLDEMFTQCVNELRLFIMLGVPRKKLAEKGYSSHILDAAYSKFNDEVVEHAIIRRVSKLIKEKQESKEKILKKGYSEEDYEKAMRFIETE